MEWMMDNSKENELDKLKAAYKRKNGKEPRSKKCMQCGEGYFLVLANEDGLSNSDPADDYRHCSEHILLDILEMYEMNTN